MSKIRIARLQTTKPQNFIDIDVNYQKGGISYANYKRYPRGYYLSVQPVTIEQHVGYESIGYRLFSGVSHLVEETARFSQKRLEALAAQGENLPQYKELLAQVLAKENITLGAPVAALGGTCGQCGAQNAIVNQCGCDPNNLPTRVVEAVA